MNIESLLIPNCLSVLHLLPIGVYITDQRRKILFWNQAAEAITGYSAADVVGRACFDNLLAHIDEDGNPLCTGLCPLARSIQDGATLEGEYFLHHKNGHRMAVRVRTLPLLDETGVISGALEIFSDMSEYTKMRRHICELEKIAMFDRLSGLPNREHLESKIEIRLHELTRYGYDFGLLFLDIDHFKRFNDTYGHEAGDNIIRAVAATLQSASRPFDLFGRWGGEEFAGVIRHVTHENLTVIANRYRTLIEQTSVRINGKKVGVTVSIGATLAKKEDSVAAIIKRADLLMYDCKKSGRNCVAADPEARAN